MARDHGLHDVFAHAATRFELAEWRHGYKDADTASALLKEALDTMPAEMSARRVSLMSSLARARLSSGVKLEAKRLALEAIAMARALGDPAAIAASLAAFNDFPAEAEEAGQLLADAIEMVILAERVGNLEILSQAHYRHAVHALELGDAQTSRAAIEAMVAVNQRLRQPVFTLFDIGFRTTLALLRGDLADAERVILQGLRLRTPSTTHSFDPLSVLIFTLRREQGRLDELRPLVLAFAQSSGTPAWQPGLALMLVEFGDLPAARSLFEELAQDEFAALPRDGRWTVCVVYLAEICAALGDTTRAAVLYRLLLPWSGLNIVVGGVGPSNRFLGLLATTMSRWTDAERHYIEALAMSERTGALAQLAHTLHDYAAMLLARGLPGDQSRARELLNKARDSAATLGLVAVTRKVDARLAALSAPTAEAPDDLTAREMDVLRLLAIGRGNADIALVLEISLNTVATHVRDILGKTGCANRTEAAAYAMRHGLQAGG